MLQAAPACSSVRARAHVLGRARTRCYSSTGALFTLETKAARRRALAWNGDASSPAQATLPLVKGRSVRAMPHPGRSHAVAGQVRGALGMAMLLLHLPRQRWFQTRAAACKSWRIAQISPAQACEGEEAQ